MFQGLFFQNKLKQKKSVIFLCLREFLGSPCLTEGHGVCSFSRIGMRNQYAELIFYLLRNSIDLW